MNLIYAVLPIIAGFLLDIIIGDPYWLFHPVRLIGSLISLLEKAVRKLFKKHLRIGGAVLAAIVLLASIGIPAALLYFMYKLNVWLGIAVESILCFYCLAARSLKKESMKVCAALENNDTEKARKAVSMIVGRDTKTLDNAGIAKAAVETVAENASDGVCAPLFYMALFGAVGALFYKAANTMDSMIAYKNEKYKDIGFAAAKIDDVLNFIPSRLCALLMIVSSGILRMNMKNAVKIWRRDRRKHASPNSAQTESVCAGALGLRLGGDAYYFGELHKKQFIGDSLHEIEPNDIRRANSLMYTASALMLIIVVIFRAAFIFGLSAIS
ncbi:MAG: cobalamin biosynthesis protein CobD [Oscillospiraceae bacterium]|nr:cobalamin biosynthesis protein CobD [Oscillospiraceae bacterium]